MIPSRLVKGEGGEGGGERRCRRQHARWSEIDRCKVAVQLTDVSATVNATIFNNCADRLLCRTAEEVHAIDKQPISKHLQEINDQLKTGHVIAEIKATKKKYNNNITRYAVQEWIVNNKSEVEATTSTKEKAEAKDLGGESHNPDKMKQTPEKTLPFNDMTRTMDE